MCPIESQSAKESVNITCWKRVHGSKKDWKLLIWHKLSWRMASKEMDNVSGLFNLFISTRDSVLGYTVAREINHNHDM